MYVALPFPRVSLKAKWIVFHCNTNHASQELKKQKGVEKQRKKK